MSQMQDAGIQCGVHYSTVHNIECYKSDFQSCLGKSIVESEQTVSIPFNEKLTDKQVEYVVGRVKEYAVFT